MYFTPYTDSIGAERFERGDHGVIVTPGSHRPNRFDLARASYWCADNGCFAAGDRFDLEAYLRWLASFSTAAKRQAIFATAPDVVGCWHETLERSLPTLPAIRAAGFPVALVLQDGATPASVPWSSIDAVFVGGSTEWKLGGMAEAIVGEANERGLWSHMGRVNSIKRMKLSAAIGCYSADGTLLCFGPDANLPRLERMVRETYAEYGDVGVDPDWNHYATGLEADEVLEPVVRYEEAA